MTSLKSSRKQIRPLSETKSVDFHSNQATNIHCDEHFYCDSTDIASDSSVYEMPECLDKSSICKDEKTLKTFNTLDDGQSSPRENHFPEKSTKLYKLKQSNHEIDKKGSSFNLPLKSKLELTSETEDFFEFKSNSLSDYALASDIYEDHFSKFRGSDASNEDTNSGEFKQLFSLKKPNNSLFRKNEGSISPNEMKTKLRSMWNNVKYGWRVKREANLKTDSAAWLLGRCYHNKLTDASNQLKLDLLSKIWLTYRINFPMIPGTEFVSDSGWGCMLRCGQMMMAQALICHFLHRDWRIASDQPEEIRNVYKMILRWFGDSLSNTNPFSLHQLVLLGEKYGRKAGDWYGPTHAAQVLSDALQLSQKYHPQLKDVCMYVALDGTVFKQDIQDLCRKSSKESTPFLDDCPSYSEFGPPSFNTALGCWKSLILFVSVRLGNDKINPFYIPSLKSLLTYEQCIGIIGGRPKHALYFIGWQDEKLIHLDPHACQPAVDVGKEDFNDKSFHSSSIRMISFTEIDPSCAIGFYFKKEEEFQNFVEKFPEITASLKKSLDYPVFALVDGRRADVEVDFISAYTRSTVQNSSCKEDDDGYILL